MSCGCQKLDRRDGKAIVDLVRGKGKADMVMPVEHEIECSCGSSFLMKKFVDRCPSCEMTYGVTPCSSRDKENIVAAGINY